MGFLAPSLRPSNSLRSAIGYTPPPPTVLSLPVTEPTKIHRGSGALCAVRRSGWAPKQRWSNPKCR
eukprot:scaffold153005_cov32-Tisochrysis_lutea.AAC.3